MDWFDSLPSHDRVAYIVVMCIMSALFMAVIAFKLIEFIREYRAFLEEEGDTFRQHLGILYREVKAMLKEKLWKH